MRHQCPTHEIKEQASLYALGVLNQLEARAFESHVREGCEICRSELSRFERAAGMFALNAPQIKPPAYLIDLLLARIEKETLERPAQSRRTLPKALVRLSERVKVASTVIPWRLIGARAIPWAAAAALGIVAIMLLTALNSARSAGTNQNQAITQSKAEIVQMHALVERATNRSKELAQIVAVLGVPGARQVQLVGEGPGASSKVALYLDENTGLSVVSADRLPMVDGMVHHLWFVTPEGPKDAGTLETDASGHGFLATSAGANFARTTAACITLEPEGASDHPTAPILALGKIIRTVHPRRQHSSAPASDSPDSPSSQPDSQQSTQPTPRSDSSGKSNDQ